MKDYPYVPSWRLNKDNNKPAINHSVLMFTTHGVAEGEWNGNEWIQYRWSGKVKDSDVLYWIHLEDLTQLEKEGENIQQEQLDVELQEAAAAIILKKHPIMKDAFTMEMAFYEMLELVKAGYELGLNARKEENK